MFSQLVSAASLALAVLSVAPPAVPSRSGAPQERGLVTAHFVVTAGDALEPKDLQVAASAAEDVYAEVAAFTGGIPSGDPIRCTLYSSLEAKGLATGYTTPAHAFSASGTVVASMETGFDGEGRRELAVVLLRRALGRPVTHLLEEGLSVRFAERWWGMDRARLLGLASALAATGLGDDLDRWFDSRKVHVESGLIVRVAGAALVEAAGGRATVPWRIHWLQSHFSPESTGSPTWRAIGCCALPSAVRLWKKTALPRSGVIRRPKSGK